MKNTRSRKKEGGSHEIHGAARPNLVSMRVPRPIVSKGLNGLRSQHFIEAEMGSYRPASEIIYRLSIFHKLRF